MDKGEIVDAIMRHPSGTIAAINLLQGHYIAQFDRDELGYLMGVWATLIVERNAQELEVGHTLGECIFDYDNLAKRFPGFPDLRLRNRCADASSHASLERATVRDSMFVPDWADVKYLESKGIDFRAQPGSVSYEYLESRADHQYTVSVYPAATITAPRHGERAILFYTLAETLWSEIIGVPFARRADFARDELGLVHMRSDKPQVILFLDPAHVEGSENGRPTALDSGGNPRFVCYFDDATSASDCWGWTAQLADACSGNVKPGRRERVTGAFPPVAARGGITLKLGILGAPAVPRADILGSGDAEFSDLLHQIFLDRGMVVREALLAIFPDPTHGAA